MLRRVMSVVGVMTVLGCSPHASRPGREGSAPPAATKQSDTYASLESEVLTAYFRSHPVRATALGQHGGDARLPDRSAAATKARIAELGSLLSRVETLDGLSVEETYDRTIIAHALRAERTELTKVRSWQRNPMVYNRVVGRAVSTLIDREFAPLSVRLAALTARLSAVPGFLRVARANLTDVPPLWADMAVKLAGGTISFLRDKLPAALSGQGLAEEDAESVQRFEAAHGEAIAAVREFRQHLEQTVRPAASGDFRLGRALFEQKLREEEHVTLTVDELTAMNEAAIVRYRKWATETAARIAPDKSVEEVMADVVSQHPAPADLLKTAEKYVIDARDHIVEKSILTLPHAGLPIVRPTPEYARTGFASMSTPGPFETVASAAYYNVTNVDPAWSGDQQEQHLTYFNYPGLLGISVHEAMPGHYVQRLYLNGTGRDARRVFFPASVSEGWAHYCEQMMVDEGLGDGDPRIRLGQLRRALQRHARWYAGIALHVDGKSLEEVAKRFEEIAYFAPFPALRETQRGTYNPTYLYYALGRMQILELREAYRMKVEAAGGTFSLKDFHDRFLRLGLPLSLSRDAMLR